MLAVLDLIEPYLSATPEVDVTASMVRAVIAKARGEG
jgi:hypothetical protein